MNPARLIILLLMLAAGTALAETKSAEPDSDTESVAPAPEDRFADAQAMLRSGEADMALPIYSELTREFPGNVDYALGRAQSLVALGRTRDASLELERAIPLAPDYEDLWILLFRLLNEAPDLVDRDKLAELQADARRRFPDAEWWHLRRQTDFPLRVTLVLGAESLTNDQPGWRNQALRVDWAFSEASEVFVELDRRERFSQSDTVIALGARRAFAGDWYAGGTLRVAADVDFSATSDVAAFIGSELGGGWVAELRARYLDYDVSTVRILGSQFEYYFGDYRLAYAFSLSRLDNIETSLSHAFYFDWYQSEKTRYGISVFTGEEAESIAPGVVLQTDTRGLGAYVRHELTNRFAVRLSLGTSEQGDFYRRRYAGLAVTAGF